MPRIWLDATVDDFDLTSQQWRPPVPPIPEEQLSPHTPQTPTTPLRKRRSSMPPPLTREGGVRRKRVTRHKKTPDVISSLVDSLSTISSPAQEHFDAIPSINGSSTRSGRHLWRIRSTEDALRDTRLDYRALGQVGGIIDDAAIPPVIKTAPPPSGFSPITAPKPPKAHTTSLFFGRSSSRTSLQSQRSSEVASIVNPSVDSIARANSTGHDSAAVIPDIPTGPKDFGGIYEEEEDDDEGVAVIPDIRGGSKRHKHRSLMFTPSQERIREKAAQNKRNTVSLGEEAANLLHLPRPRHRSNSPEKRHVFDPPIEEGETTPSRPEEIFGTKSSGKRAVRNAVLPSGASPDVPKRQSSLAHTDGSSFASSSKSRRRSNRAEGSSNRSPSNQSDPKKPPTRETSVSKTDTVPEEAFKLEDDAELDMEVINRIKELKARKELREKEAEALKSLHPPETGPSKSRSSSARRGRSASDPPPPFPNEDSKMLLAHKPSLLQKRASTNDIVRGRNLTVDANRPTQPPRDPSRPKTPITPIEATSLPINYKYVLQTLERESRADKDGSSRASTKASSLKGRPKTLPAGIGGRSAVGRQTTTKSVEKDKDTTSVRNPSPRRATINVGPRANSEDSKPPVRYQKPDDLGFTLEPSLVPAPLAPARNSSKKKKRWSHPDLPLSVDVQGQKSKEKNSRKSRDTEPLAVKPVEPPTPVAEERPSTSDSIDDDIKSFVHAPRLTQKIRHPPTGRTIAFSEVGDPKGHAVFCCVGMGLTRYVTAFYDELAATLKLRLITPDRPGIGESAADAAGSNPLSWPGTFSFYSLAMLHRSSTKFGNIKLTLFVRR